MQTFLFTDIEGSTRLWEEHPDQMAAALARHDAILTAAILVAEGQVIKATGDGMLARFESAPAALVAAIESQKALGLEPWGAIGSLKVRMGIHTGESEQRDGDYFGPTMNRTARIMASGHGGQVLFSGMTASLVDGRLPEGAGFRDLGTHRLKDLTQPEHLFQLVHDRLESEFPALATLDSRPHNLPLQATEFFGRSSEISTIDAMLRAPGTKLVTITGPGGAGKTRLGLQVAAEQIERFAGGVFFVDLSAERDPDAAYEAIVRTLALPVSGGGDPLQILRSRLRDKEMLLVLDNFEQVTDAAVGLSELLNHAPGLKVVVTSRETLRVRAEHVFPVPPLSLPHPKRSTADIAASESVQLFAERAMAVRPDFVITDENASVIAEICNRLDGLPLAIELAAARLNVFTPSDLLERLRTRLDVLGAGGRDLPDRQRTLWGAIAWSYELLDDKERGVFELMSVFSPTRLAAIEAVASDLGYGFVIDTLGALVDKSLIRSDESGGSQRFSMLLMIKEYAETLLAAQPERDREIRQAHALYFSAFTQRLKERLGGNEREAALADLVSEIGNLRTAWRYWVQQDNLEQLFALLDGLWVLHEAKGWYRAAIELATDTLDVLGRAERSEELAAEELTLRTSLARAVMAVRGYGPEVEAAFKRVLEMSEAGGSAAQRFPVIRALATYYMNLTDFASAAEMGRQILELGERENDDSVRAEGHYVFGVNTAFSGDLDTGLHHLERSIEMHDPRIQSSNRFRLGPSTGVVARVATGLLYWQGGEIERGISRVADALRFAQEIDHPFSAAYAIYHNGFLAMGRYRFDDSLQRARELAAIAEEHDYPLWSTLAKVLEGVSLTALGETERGLALTEVAIDLYRGMSTPPIFWPLVLGLRAQVQALAGQPERALELAEEAMKADPQGMDPDLLVMKGDFLTMLPSPDAEGAEAAYLTAIEYARLRKGRLAELRAQTHLVDLRRKMGRSADASELAALYSTFSDGFDEFELMRARELLGPS
ncbi:MAG TPA: adenylate/guanylate cyclase domain-containing protein [Acidimicrobiia bacterium]|nr:adenylate/guanylate cyclase domain-containing protein [Acidimicrobiia bacterium]